MKILHKDFKHGVVKVLVSNLDDLWALYNIVEKNDVVHARTTREVKQDFSARPNSKRIPVNLGVRVQRVYFDRELNRLRVHGIVALAPEELNVRGSHHTLDLAVGDEASVVKEHWYDHQVDRLEKAIHREDPIVVVGLDADEACVAVIRPYGPDVKAEIPSRLPGKNEPEKRDQAMLRYLAEVAKSVESASAEQNARIVVVGPGFVKDNFAAYLRDKYTVVAGKVATVKSVSSGGVSAVYETLRIGLIAKVMRENRAMYEISVVEEVLRRLASKAGNVSHGLEEVERDGLAGAVENLLICDDTLRGAEDEARVRLENVLRTVEQRAGRVTVVSTQHEGGKKLISLGGLAALLRYSRHYAEAV
jgi:protein pelota